MGWVLIIFLVAGGTGGGAAVNTHLFYTLKEHCVFAKKQIDDAQKTAPPVFHIYAVCARN